MAFPPRFLDEIRARLSCSEVIGRRVRLVRKGREHSGLCPFHNEKTPSFTVNDDKGFFHCFGCGAHGDVIGFAMRIDNLTFPEAVERLAGEAGLEMPRQTVADRARAEVETTLYDVVEAACAWFEAQLRSPPGRSGLEYLRGRGLDDATIARFRLGYAPDARAALKAALLAKGFKESLLLQAGLIVRPEDGRDSFDFFRGRVIFPIADRRGRIIAFGGRVMGDGQPKYLNSRDTPLFDKGRTLYALDKARDGVRPPAGKAPAELIVAEGYMDVIALHAAGFNGAVAPLGTALTEAQIEALWKLAPEPIVCLDGDAAGQRAALRAADRALPMLKPGFSLRFAALLPGEDPDSLIRHHGPSAVTDVLARARPLVDIIWEAETAGRPIDTPERRAALAERLKQKVRVIADRTVQDQYYQALVRDRLWTSFRPPRSSKGRQFLGKGTAVPMGAKSSGDVRTLQLRQAQVLLATLINHVGLIFAEFEAISELELPAGDLDTLRQEILNLASQNPDLDSAMLKSQLKETGLAAVLAGLAEPNLYKLWPFSGPAASFDEAQAGWRHMATLFQRRRLEGEVAAARADLGREMTEESWARLGELQRQVREADDVDLDADEAVGPRGSTARPVTTR
ncbi:MAG TPA: DNA primase [Alphaproteobacteria bacterium]|nr:DNA primase [Alphaproteobacteria bacterium]